MTDAHVLLDIRGLVLQHLHSGSDKEATTDSITGRLVNTPGHCIDNLVTDVLLPTFKDFRLKRVIAVWDGGNDYREKLSGGVYKAHRKEKEQSPELKSATDEALKAVGILLSNLGIMQVRLASVEADDVIAYLVDRLPGNVLIHTVDRDLMRLAAPREDKREVAVCCRRQWATEFVDKDVTVPFRWVTLYKSLVGDTSDNIKGISGFGPKSWVKLTEIFKDEDLEEIERAVSTEAFAPLYDFVSEHPQEFPLLEKMLDAKAEWILGWKLANFHPELVNMRQAKKFLRPQWTVRVPNSEKLAKLLRQYGCMHLADELGQYMPTQTLITAANATEQGILEDARALFAESPFISIDWETWAPENLAFKEAANGREVVDMLSSRITGMGITCGRDLQHTFYLSVGHKDTPNLPSSLIPKLIDLMGDKPKVIQNFYFEQSVYRAQFGLDLSNCRDTKIMANHHDETESNGLKDLSKRILNYDQTRYGDVIEPGKTMADYSAEHVFKYGADDPLVTSHLYEFLKLQLQLEGTWDFVRDYEFPAVYPLVEAYLQGVELDWDTMKVLAEADRNTYDTSMARLRTLLRENQTPEMITEGVQRLLAYEREVVDAEVKAGKKSEDDASVSVATLWTRLRERAEYRDITKVPVELKVSVTLTQLNTACEYLGLPRFNDLKRETVAKWREDVHYITPVRSAGENRINRFVSLIGENDANLKNFSAHLKKGKPEQLNLLRLLSEVLHEALPEEKKYKVLGSELSLNSPPQMQVLLYGMMNLPIRLRAFEATGTRKELGLEGSAQANEDAILMALVMDAPEGCWQREALNCLLKAKKADTRAKMFYTAYPLWKHPLTGRVHSQLNSVGAETRRMSGNAPNPMQLPKKGEGVKFRTCFLPSKGHDLIISIDFAGEELRVGAGLSLDPAMLGCYVDANTLRTMPAWMRQTIGPALCRKFESSKLSDMHSQTGSKIARLPYEEFEAIRHDKSHPEHKRIDDSRKIAKTVNFGAQYGIGAPKLARQLLCSPEDAQVYLDAKKAAFSGFEAWRERVIREVHTKGYVRTLYGSYKHVFNRLFDADPGMVGYLERASVNYMIQGLCADYLKVVLTDIHHQEVLKRHNVHLIAPIHDELVFSCSSRNAAAFICEVHDIMVQGIPGLPCPIWAEPSLGPNFGTQVEIGPWPTPELVEEAIDKALDRRAAA